MMIKISNKGSSDYLKEGIISYVIFIIFLGILISFGAGDYITSDVILKPPVPSEPSSDWFGGLVNGLIYAWDNLAYFINLLSLSVNLQMFTGIVLIPFFILLVMYIIETIRGN